MTLPNFLVYELFRLSKNIINQTRQTKN